jgi:hypothetical protein
VHVQEAASGDQAEHRCQEQTKCSAEKPGFVLSHFLLDPKKTEEEKHEDQGGTELAPNFFLAHEKPEQMKAEIEDDEMIENAHGSLNKLIQ